MKTENLFTAFSEQKKFADAVFSGVYKWLLLAGDIRSGKTIICLAILVMLCKIYSGSRWCVIRKDLPVIKRNTLPTFFKYCCPQNFLLNYNKAELLIKFKNQSEIFFLSENAQDDPEGLKFLGLEVNGCLFEQLEECQEKTFEIMKSRTGQWKIDPMPPQLIVANCNPADNWVKTTWFDNWSAGKLEPPYYFQEADIRKNPYIDEDYIKTLMEDWPDALRNRFLERRWESMDNEWQLVSWNWIYNCQKRLPGKKSKTKYLGVDVGRQGSDPSVWVMAIDDNIEKINTIPKTDIDEVYDITKNMIVREGISPQNVCIDCVGLGAGVGDFLYNKDKMRVIRFFGGEGCEEYLENTSFKFKNLRSWSNWVAANELKNNNIGNFVDSKLVSEAGAMKYAINNDKEIVIMSKEDFKKKMKRSSDYWDAFTYMVWAKRNRELVPKPGLVAI